MITAHHQPGTDVHGDACVAKPLLVRVAARNDGKSAPLGRNANVVHWRSGASADVLSPTTMHGDPVTTPPLMQIADLGLHADMVDWP